MRGEQYHHNNPSELCDNLYLCAFRAISSKVMLDLGITCSINATVELPTFAYQKQDCMQIAVEDRVSDGDWGLTVEGVWFKNFQAFRFGLVRQEGLLE